MNGKTFKVWYKELQELAAKYDDAPDLMTVWYQHYRAGLTVAEAMAEENPIYAELLG